MTLSTAPALSPDPTPRRLRPSQPGSDPAQSLPVYRAADFLAVDGANLGDPIADADELIAGDVYMLAPGAERLRLSVHPVAEAPRLTVGEDTDCGTPGATVCLDSCLTLMSPDGATVEALILVELHEDATIRDVWFFPLAELAQKVGYALVAIDRDSAWRRLAESACVSFTRGTRITLSSGAQVPIEELKVGDKVLTRDNGPQEIRWIGQQTVRATGSFAPIRIRAGTLNNDGDLIVSPNHRLFVYQRRDAVRAGRAEVLVKVKYLVNGDTVVRTDGGFVDYFQLLFHRHEIIYAEGIAAESLMVNTRTRPALPTDVQEGLRGDVTTPAHRDLGVELGRDLLRQGDMADLLRRASAC